MPLPNDGPIHQPIFKVRQGDLNHLPRLVDALSVSPLVVLLEKPDDLTSCRFLVYKDVPFVIAFTNPFSLAPWRDNAQFHELEVTALDLCAVIKDEGTGIYLNPGDAAFAFPVYPKLLAKFRELTQVDSR